MMAFFILYEFYLIFARKHPYVYTYYQLNNLINPTVSDGVKPFDSGFDIALTLNSKNSLNISNPLENFDA
jgi:hypothetical protein